MYMYHNSHFVPIQIMHCKYILLQAMAKCVGTLSRLVGELAFDLMWCTCPSENTLVFSSASSKSLVQSCGRLYHYAANTIQT